LRRVWRVTATDVQTLAEASFAIHDALFDRDEVRYDPGRALLVIPFRQEGWPSGPAPERELVRESWRIREYRVALYRGELRIRQVISQPEHGDGWGDPGQLNRLEFDSARSELCVEAGDILRVPVTRLDVEVEITPDIAGYLRRRVGKLTGTESDRPWRA
jgi:hypothetical protein